MQWWTDFLDWASNGDGARTIAQTALPFAAIVIAGVIAALIGRATAKHVVGVAEQELTRGVLAAMIGAGRRHAVWDTLTMGEQQYAQTSAAEAEVRLRMLPRTGAEAAADWAVHELEALKSNSVHYGRSSEHGFAEFRDRLVEWHFRPRRARKLFLQDLERWRFEQGETATEQPAAAPAAQPRWEPAPSAAAVQPAASPQPAASDLAAQLSARQRSAEPAAVDPAATQPHQTIAASPVDGTDTGVVIEGAEPPKPAFRREQD